MDDKLAPKSVSVPKRRRGPGRPFTGADDPRRCAAGLPAETRAIRQSVREKLDAAFTNKDGTDGLVQAIVAGVVERDSMCLKLAAEYRWGKAPVVVEDQDGNDVSRLPLSQLVVMVQNALVVLGKEDDET